jgi:hypothetical protein
MDEYAKDYQARRESRERESARRPLDPSRGEYTRSNKLAMKNRRASLIEIFEVLVLSVEMLQEKANREGRGVEK